MHNNLLKELLPPIIKRFLTGLFYGWHGNYSSWTEAKMKCSGYDSPDILEKVKQSSLKVKSGSAVFERDSVIFDNIEYSFPLLSGLLWIANQNGGKINVLDFGGSLGSSYYQNKFFLDPLSQVNWCVVEQPQFVTTGIEDFENERLHFFHTIDDCVKSYNIDVVLISSVLQYIEQPYEILEKVYLTGISHLIIDRTPFVSGPDRITVQKVNPKYYKGSYPCWFFNEEKFESWFTGKYNLISKFDALDKANVKSEFRGYIYQKSNL